MATTSLVHVRTGCFALEPLQPTPEDDQDARTRALYLAHGLPLRSYAFTGRMRNQLGVMMKEYEARTATDTHFVAAALHYGYQFEVRTLYKPTRFSWLHWRMLQQVMHACLVEHYEHSFFSLPLSYCCEPRLWYDALEHALDEAK